jgi:diamine N-acetyltransferase
MINGDKICLRAPLDKDKEFFFNLRNDLHLQMMLLSRPRANSKLKISSWLEKRLAEEDTLFFVVVEKHSNNACGFVQLTNIDLIDRVGSLGICIGGEYLSQGYAHEALHLFEEYIGNVFNIRKIVLEVLSTNERAIKFYLKSGYINAGILRQHVFQFNSFHDVSLMEKFI